MNDNTPPEMKETPRTDAITYTLVCDYWQEHVKVCDPEKVKELERELTAANAALVDERRLRMEKDETATTFMNQVKKLQAELLEARKALSEVSTHLTPIRRAFESLRISTGDDAGSGYYSHELKAHKDYSEAIDAALTKNKGAQE